MKRLLFVCCLILHTILFAQSKINFEFDFARYSYDSTSNYLEIYYSVGENGLTRININDSIFVESLIHIKIKDVDSEKYLVDNRYKVNSLLDSTETGTNGKNFIGVVGYKIPNGNYSLNITASDLHDSTNKVVFSEPLQVSSFIGSRFLVSDIELASRIVTESKNTNSIFYKNTMEVLPNPVSIFGQNYPMVFYYCEVYNLLEDTTEKELIVNKQVLNSLGNKVYEQSKKLPAHSNSIVEVGALNVTKYPTGSYTLYLNIVNTQQNLGVSSVKKFFVINPGVVDTTQITSVNTGVMGSEFGVLSEEECDQMFNSAKYFASSSQISQYEKLDSVNAKREFLFNFWKSLDSDPSTQVNEFKNEYERRLEHADARYRTFSKPGYKTDRGRIYLIYGEPDEVELHPNDFDKKPYELWYYHSIEGGVIFVFGDIVGYGDFELLHSTKRGELRDDNWVRRIVTN